MATNFRYPRQTGSLMSGSVHSLATTPPYFVRQDHNIWLRHSPLCEFSAQHCRALALLSCPACVDKDGARTPVRSIDRYESRIALLMQVEMSDACCRRQKRREGQRA